MPCNTKKRKRKMNKKGTITLYLSFFILAVIIIVLAAILAPMGVMFNSQMYEVGEQLLIDSNGTINQINDATVRGQIQTSLSSAIDSQQNNIEVNAAIFQYGWVFVIIITALVLFIFARRLIEVGGGIV